MHQSEIVVDPKGSEEATAWTKEAQMTGHRERQTSCVVWMSLGHAISVWLFVHHPQLVPLNCQLLSTYVSSILVSRSSAINDRDSIFWGDIALFILTWHFSPKIA